MTDASTATRIKATRVTQTERIIRDWAILVRRTPARTLGIEPDTEMQTGGQEAPVTRKRSDAERLEEETAETAEADADKRIALKRKAENDPSDSEVEDSAMNSLAELWHREDDPDGEVDLLIFQQRDRYVARVHETGGDKPVCEEPKTLFPYDECGCAFIGDTSGKLLNNPLVEKARAEEISVIRELGVWKPGDEVVFGTRLVDINKGDEHKPFYRSRLVVQEYKRQADGSFFTATPPVETLRSLLICATIDELPNELGQPNAWTEPVVLMLIVRRAHFYSPSRRKVFVELPEEASTDESKVGLLLRSMYGCREAGVKWEFAICQVMIAIGFVQGRASPCLFRHLEKQLRVWVHGDNFVPLSYIVNVTWFCVKLQEFWVVTNQEIIGPPGYHDCVQSIRVLSRIVEWTPDGITGEAGPRHAELIRKSFGVTGRSVATPGVRDKLTDIEGAVPIDKEASDRYRGNTMRAQHLSADTPNIQIECSDLARTMKQPSNLDEMGLKRLALFLGVRARLVWLFKWQKRVTRIEFWCDTDHAVCIRTRKSVSGCALMLEHVLPQAVIALSSGEAEYYELVSATSQMLGVQSILLDRGWKFHAHVWMDATAGIAIESRRGLERVKHIDTVFLWVQAMVTEGKISLGQKPTKEMLADFLTKHADAATMQSCMAGLGTRFQSGESKLTLKA